MTERSFHARAMAADVIPVRALDDYLPPQPRSNDREQVVLAVEAPIPQVGAVGLSVELAGLNFLELDPDRPVHDPGPMMLFRTQAGRNPENRAYLSFTSLGSHREQIGAVYPPRKGHGDPWEGLEGPGQTLLQPLILRIYLEYAGIFGLHATCRWGPTFLPTYA